MKKIKKYADIEPNHRMVFEMLYNHSLRALKELEKEVTQACGGKLPPKSQISITRMQHKLEQMVARGKQKNNE